jgi:hypothetical protein
LKSVYAALCRSCDGETVETSRTFDELQRTYDRMVASTEPAMLSHIADLQDRVRALNETLDDMQSSPLWQATRPFRKVERMVSRVLLNATASLS